VYVVRGTVLSVHCYAVRNVSCTMYAACFPVVRGREMDQECVITPTRRCEPGLQPLVQPVGEPVCGPGTC
jgi:hypothetical protein